MHVVYLCTVCTVCMQSALLSPSLRREITYELDIILFILFYFYDLFMTV